MMEVFNKVKSILVKQIRIKKGEVKMDATLADDLGVNSVDFVELIILLEDEFNLEIPEEDARKILTVGELVKYIKDRQ